MNSKWAVIALCASLAVNLALGGFVLGQSLKRPPAYGADPVRVFPRWARGLPEARRDALRPYLREHMRAMRPHVRGLRAQHGTLTAALRAAPYNPDALTAALAALRESRGRMQADGDAAFAAFVAELSHEERLALAENIARPRHRGGRERAPPPHRGEG